VLDDFLAAAFGDRCARHNGQRLVTGEGLGATLAIISTTALPSATASRRSRGGHQQINLITALGIRHDQPTAQSLRRRLAPVILSFTII
jgi:hypothetical protein